MKKLAALFLALTLAFSLALPACGEGADLTGIWVLEKVLLFREEVSPVMAEVRATLILKADGTLVLDASVRGKDSLATGTWTMENGVCRLVDGRNDVLTAQYEPATGRLLVTKEPLTLVMTRKGETSAASPGTLPAPVATESEAAFLGTWRLTAASGAGAASPIRTNWTLTLESGRMTLRRVQPDGTAQRVMETVFGDGVMRFADHGDTGALQLMEDGTLSMRVDDGPGIVYFFTRAE